MRSGPLLEYLFGQQGEQVLVAAVPILENDVGGQVDILPDSDEAGDVKPRQVATAARVLQITRNTQVDSSAALLYAIPEPGFVLRPNIETLCADWRLDCHFGGLVPYLH